MEEKVREQKTPLGIRLKNPLNIRKSKSKWIGAIDDGPKGKFVRFQSFYFGWRAACIIMAKTYYKRGWNTPQKIIENWAPYTENNTTFYISFVCKYADLNANDEMPHIKIGKTKWKRLLIAMAKIEIGYRWISEEIIAELDKALDNVIENY